MGNEVAVREHSKLSPSTSKRWIACPGSIALIEKAPPQKPSKYADEGTAAHFLGETCLRDCVEPEEYLGKTIKNFKVTEEMAEAVKVYTDLVRELSPDKDVTLLRKLRKIEQRFSLAWLYPGIFGSNDACVYDVDAKKLHVLDYKHGAGVVVDPEWNSQLMMYALGACHELWASQTEKTRKAIQIMQMVDEVELIIVQPRAFSSEGPIRRWTISVNDLFYWGLHVLRPAALATEKKDARLCVGDHCRFCPALALCPAQIKSACELAKCDFDDPILPDPSRLTPDDIVKVLHASEVFNTWSNEVKAYAQSRAEAGLKIPGFKLVAKKSNRRWIDEDTAAATLESFLGEGAYEKSVLSIAQAEKALKKVGVSPESALDGLWQKPETGVTLVPETDKRHEVGATVLVDFLDDADFLQ